MRSKMTKIHISLGKWKKNKNKNKNQQVNVPTPTPYIEQRQQLQEEERQLELERERFLQSLKNAARNLIERTRKGLHESTCRDNADVLNCNTLLKQKDMEFKEYIDRIQEIKDTLNLIVNGEYQKIIELKHNSLFLGIFPNFDFKTFAAHSGKPGLIQYINSKAFLESLEIYRYNFMIEQFEIKRKKESDIIHQNLNPNFKPLLERPLIERIAAVFSYEYYSATDKELTQLCGSFDHLKNYWKFKLESGYPQKELTISNATIFVDNVSRLIQSLINQFFDNRLPDPQKDRNKLIQVLTMGLFCIIESQTMNYQPNSADLYKNTKHYSFIYSFRLLLAGLVRVLSEKCNYGENIGALIKDAKNLYFNPINDEISKLFNSIIEPTFVITDIVANGKADIKQEWFLVNAYRNITASGKYPIGDPRILLEAKQTFTDYFLKKELENNQKNKSEDFNKIGVLYFKLFEKYGDSGINYYECNLDIRNVFKSLNLNQKENIESDSLCQIADLYVYLLNNRSIKQSFETTLALLGVMIKASGSNLTENELNNKIQAAFMGSLSQVKFNEKMKSQSQYIAFYNMHKNEVTHFFNKFNNYEKLSKLSYMERHKEERLNSLKLTQEDAEIADLMVAYLEVAKQSKLCLGDPKILLQALERKTQFKQEDQVKALNNLSPFNSVPNIIEPGQQIKLELTQKSKYRIVTPEVLALEAQQGKSIFDKQQKQLAESVNAKIKSKLSTEIPLLESSKPALIHSPQNNATPYLASEPGLSLSVTPAQNALPNNSQSQIFKIYEEGQYILESVPDEYSKDAEIYSKSFQVRHKTLFKTKLPLSCECGNYSIEFNELTSGTLTLTQGNNIKIQTCISASKLEFTLDTPGLVEITFKLKENPTIIEQYQVHVYAKPIDNLKDDSLSFYEENQNTVFTYKDVKFSSFSKGHLFLESEDHSFKKHHEDIQSEYQTRLKTILNLFRGDDNEKLTKIQIIAKRLLPESMIFAPFIAMAGYLDEYNRPLGVNELAHLLSQQVAIHELCRKYNPKLVYEYINANENIFPEHWSTICKLMHEDTEESILKALILQLTQVNAKCQKNQYYKISPEAIFALARQLYLLKNQNQLMEMLKTLDNSLYVEPFYLQWLSEVNSILGEDKEGLKTVDEHIKLFKEYQTDLFYLNKIHIADDLGLNRKENFKDSVNIGTECLNEIDVLKAEFDQMNKKYEEQRQNIHNSKLEIDEAIQDYYRRYRQNHAEMQKAIKKAKRKQRIGLLKNIIIGVGIAFFAPFITPALVGASTGWAAMLTESALNVLGQGLNQNGFKLKGLNFKNMLKDFSVNMLTLGVNNHLGNSIKALNKINPALGYGVKALSATTISTAFNGGKPLQNLATAIVGEYFQDKFAPTKNSTNMDRVYKKINHILVNAGATTLINKEEFIKNLIIEGNKFLQGVANHYGQKSADVVFNPLEKNKKTVMPEEMTQEDIREKTTPKTTEHFKYKIENSHNTINNAVDSSDESVSEMQDSQSKNTVKKLRYTKKMDRKTGTQNEDISMTRKAIRKAGQLHMRHEEYLKTSAEQQADWFTQWASSNPERLIKVSNVLNKIEDGTNRVGDGANWCIDKLKSGYSMLKKTQTAQTIGQSNAAQTLKNSSDNLMKEVSNFWHNTLTEEERHAVYLAADLLPGGIGAVKATKLARKGETIVEKIPNVSKNKSAPMNSEKLKTVASAATKGAVATATLTASGVAIASEPNGNGNNSNSVLGAATVGIGASILFHHHLQRQGTFKPAFEKSNPHKIPHQKPDLGPHVGPERSNISEPLMFRKRHDNQRYGNNVAPLPKEKIPTLNTSDRTKLKAEIEAGRMKYEDAPYHTKHGNNVKSKRPVDGNGSLSNSIPLDPNSRNRIGYDPTNGEIIVLHNHKDGNYHGFVKKWEELKSEHQALLIRNFDVNRKGKLKPKKETIL